MNRMIPKNPLFLFACLFAPWYLLHTYVLFEDDAIVFSRYYAFTGKTTKRDVTDIKIADIQEVGFPSDLKIRRKESLQSYAHGTYIPQEIDFKTRDRIVAFNARPYTKGQIRHLLEFIRLANKDIAVAKKLANAVGFTRSE